MNLLSTAFGIHEKALAVRSQRMEVLARNIANADTPNYKAQDVDFKAMLQDVQRDTLTATNDKHYAAIEDGPDNGMRYRVPYNSSFDGNSLHGERPIRRFPVFSGLFRQGSDTFCHCCIVCSRERCCL